MEATLAYIPFHQKRAPRGAVMIVDGKEIAYVIKDRYFGEFRVQKSANAWWMDSRKVNDLIDAFKNGHTVKDACVYAVITRGQWQYFNEVHPEFSVVQEACESAQNFAFMNTINANKDDPNMARWFMEKTHPKFNPKKADSGVLQPSVQIAVGGDLNINAGTISTAIREIAREIFAPTSRGSIPDKVGIDTAVAGEEQE
jgi:hypothetical protein